MDSPCDVVERIRAMMENLDLNDDTTGKILMECTRAIRNLNKQIKRAKSVSKKTRAKACLGQIVGFQRFLKNQRVGGGAGIRRAETATHRVKWDDINSAFESRIRTGIITNMRHTDLKLFLNDCAALFKRRIQNLLKKVEALKVNAVLSGVFRINKADKVLEELKYLNTRNSPILRGTDLGEWFTKNVIEPLLVELDGFSERQSGWSLSRIVNLTLNINKYNPLRVGNYLELPKIIARREACVNILNEDEMCFAWAVVSALYPASTNINLPSSYPNPLDVLDFRGIRFPLTLHQITKFEGQNSLSINVYRLQKINAERFQVVPIFLSKNKQDKHVNLLLIQDNYVMCDELDDLTPVKVHYVWIKNLSRLLSTQLSKEHCKKFICDRCLHYFRTEEKMLNHVKDCLQFDDCVVPKVPCESHAIIEFKNYSHKEKVPFVIYADIECLLIQFENESVETIQEYQKHIPFSVGYYVKCSYDDSLSFYRSYTGPDCIKWFIKELQQFAEDVETVFLCPLPMKRLSPEELRNFKKATHCHICEKPFSQEDIKCRDHNHLTGTYRGPSHESCNLNYQVSGIIPVVFHNFSSYDGHLIIKSLAEVDGQIDILPINKEKYISFTKHIPGSLVKFRFLDSFRFLPSGLDKLASNLQEYPILKSETSELSQQQIELLTRKGVFPYDYMDSWNKLNETGLPTKEDFYSRLDDSYISLEDYDHARSVWREFECKNLKEYSELYLKTDVLLLADVFEKFRSISQETYGICPAHAYTLPGYAWQCMLYKSQQKLELLTDYNMITFIERGIRGGLSQCSKRYAEANNKYMPEYNQNKEDIYLMYFDVNNQYGWAMSQSLPYGGFKWANECDLKDFNVLRISDEADVGYILEVDLEIPCNLHDKFSDLPPCPEHHTNLGSNNKKLLATLYNKQKYVIHYRNLKQVLELGVKLTKIHRVLCFKQSSWLKPYIDLNTKLRQAAKNEFEKNFFKLMINAVFGKTMENLRNHSIVKLITKWDGRYGAEALISRPEFKSATIIDDDMIIVELAKTNVYFNKPIYVGMCILDLAKTTIYDFHYQYIKNKFSNCDVLYTDTDSLIYEIKHPDVYKVIKEDCHEHFDTCEYVEDNIYNIPRVNKKVLGMMKDENNGRIMTHFVGLRSKMYSTKIFNTTEDIQKKKLYFERTNQEPREITRRLVNLGVTKKIKGVKKSVINNFITFEDYVECLETFSEKSISQNLIISRKHDLQTVKQTKIGLSPYDTKRKISRTSHETLPWGHRDIMEE